MHPGKREALMAARALFLLAIALTLAAEPGKASVTTEGNPKFNIPPGSAKRPYIGPDAWCRQPSIVRNILKAMSSTQAVKKAGESAIDFENSTTTAINEKALTASCHGVIALSNGQHLSGTFILNRNVAGDAIWNWMNDPSPRTRSAPLRRPNMTGLCSPENRAKALLRWDDADIARRMAARTYIVDCDNGNEPFRQVPRAYFEPNGATAPGSR
jgi:hypothetical protein